MKIIPLSILSITLGVSLFARLNPFEPTDHFLEQKEMVIKANQMEQLQKEQDAINKKAQELEKEKLAKEIEVLKEKKETMLQIQKENIKAKEVIVKKAYIPEIKENFKVLPFVKIFVVNDILTIKVDKKYKLLNQDILKPNKKLVFDFEGKASFYTIRKEIISESFKSFAVGTHIEENFFRIVIDVPYDIIHYNEKIDSQNGIITIEKK